MNDRPVEDKPLSSAVLLIALSLLLITAAISLVNQYTAPPTAIAEAGTTATQDTAQMHN
jgi:hypothetical protein